MKRLDEVSRVLLRGSAVALFVSAFAQAIGFLLQVVLARVLGPVEFGYFSYAMAWLAVGLIFGKIGYDTALVRFVGEYRAQGDAGNLRRLVRHARRVTLMTGAAIACVGLLALWQIDPQPAALGMALALTAVLLPMAVYSEITAAAVRGYRRVGIALAGDGIVRPVVVLAAVGGAYASGREAGAPWATAAYVLGTLASLLCTSIVLRSLLPRQSAVADCPGPVESARWNEAALPLMLAGGFLVLLYSVDVLMLGWLADTTQAGFYSIASKVAILVLFAMNAAQSIAAPMLAGAFAGNRPEETRRIVGQMNLIAASVALPLTLGVVVAAGPLLSLLGEGFESAADCLRILALMQLLNVLTGPVGTILTMSGRQRQLVGLLALGLAVNVVLNLLLIPGLGAAGAAVAALVAHTAWNVAGAWLVARDLRLDCTLLAAFRPRAS